MPVGDIDPELAAFAQAAVADVLRMGGAVSEVVIDPAFAFDSARRQTSSTLLLKKVLGAPRPGDAFRVLGLCDCDLFIPMLSFVFGQAQLDGPAALVSTARLRQTYYRFPADRELLETRLRKEVLHEVGHTLALTHCPDPACVMSLATSIRHVDEKSDGFCASCLDAAMERLRK